MKPKAFYFVIFVCALFISFSNGYVNLKLLDNDSKSTIDDSIVYYDIAKGANRERTGDHRESRLLVPYMASALIPVVEHIPSSWDPTSFALLVVTAIFAAGTATLITYFTKILAVPSLAGIVGALLFLSSFAVVNLHLRGLVDGAETFFVLLSIILLHNSSFWPFVILMPIASMAKETSIIPITFLYLFNCLLNENVTKRGGRLLWLMICSTISFGLILLARRSVSVSPDLLSDYISLSSPFVTWQRGSFDFIKGFVYTFAVILPLATPSFGVYSRWVKIGLGLSAITVLVMGVFVGASGIAISRYIFSVVGPVLCLCAGITIVSYGLRLDERIGRQK